MKKKTTQPWRNNPEYKTVRLTETVDPDYDGRGRVVIGKKANFRDLTAERGLSDPVYAQVGQLGRTALMITVDKDDTVRVKNLSVDNPQAEIEVAPNKKGYVDIGRKLTPELQLDATTSREQMRIIPMQQAVEIIDLNSTHGTTIHTTTPNSDTIVPPTAQHRLM